MKDLIGYDTSADMHNLSVICAECADTEGDGGGAPIYRGEEWGAHEAPRCARCGADLDVRLVETSR